MAHVTEGKRVAQRAWPEMGFAHPGAVLKAGNPLCASPQGELGRSVCNCGLKVDAFLLSLRTQGLDTGPALALGQEESSGCEGVSVKARVLSPLHQSPGLSAEWRLSFTPPAFNSA